MSQTLLQLIQRIVKRLPLSSIPTSVIGSGDPGTLQLLEFLQEEGEILMRLQDWSVLRMNWSFPIIVATDPQLEPFPDDYDRTIENASAWRSGSQWVPLSGPTTPDAWHRLIYIPGTYPGYWRMSGNGMQVLGVGLGENVMIEYVSRNFVLNQNGVTTQPEFSNDDDTSLLDDRVITLGVIWRWKQSKGMEYAEDMVTYEREKELKIASDRAARPIPTSRPDEMFFLPTWPGQVIPNP